MPAPTMLEIEQRRRTFWRVRAMTQTIVLTGYVVLVGTIWSIISALWPHSHHGHHPIMGPLLSSLFLALGAALTTGSGFLVYTSETRGREDDLFLEQGSPVWKGLTLVTAPALAVQLAFEGTKKLEYHGDVKKGQKHLEKSLADHPFAGDVMRADRLMKQVEEQLGDMGHLEEVRMAREAAAQSYRALVDIKKVVDEDSAKIKAKKLVEEAATLMQTRKTFDQAHVELMAEYHNNPAMDEITAAAESLREAEKTEPFEVVKKNRKGEYEPELPDPARSERTS